MILGLHHAALAVPNIDEALAFYCDVIGFEIETEAEVPSGIDVMSEALGVADSGFKIRMLKKGYSHLELFEFVETEVVDELRPVNRTGITHIALATNDIEQDYQYLTQQGVVFNAELFGAAPDRFAYGRDPFGNVIELIEKESEVS
ncbi:MAG: VOC family protein [Pseudomonadales bacterium]